MSGAGLCSRASGEVTSDRGGVALLAGGEVTLAGCEAVPRSGGDFTGGEVTGGGDLIGGDFTAGGSARRVGEEGRSRLDVLDVDDWRATTGTPDTPGTPGTLGPLGST